MRRSPESAGSSLRRWYRLRDVLVEFSPETSKAGAAISIVTDRAAGVEEADLTSFRESVPMLGLAIYRLVLFLTAAQMLDSYLGRKFR